VVSLPKPFHWVKLYQLSFQATNRRCSHAVRAISSLYGNRPARRRVPAHAEGLDGFGRLWPWLSLSFNPRVHAHAERAARGGRYAVGSSAQGPLVGHEPGSSSGRYSSGWCRFGIDAATKCPGASGSSDTSDGQRATTSPVSGS
jgi:hypothetical protein